MYLSIAKDPFTGNREMIRYLIATGFPFYSIFAINDWRALSVYVGMQSIDQSIPDYIKLTRFDGLSPASYNI